MEEFIIGIATEKLEAGDIIELIKKKWWQRYPRVKKITKTEKEK